MRYVLLNDHEHNVNLYRAEKVAERLHYNNINPCSCTSGVSIPIRN